MTSIGNIKKGKKLKQQAQQSQMLLNTLTEREKLEAEQELESLNLEQQIDPKKAKPINTVKELDRIATQKAETADIQAENLTPKPVIPTVKDDGGRAAWLAKTANSPAAKAGFTDDERWALQQQHRKWKKNRKRK
jgi:cell division protein FtsN